MHIISSFDEKTFSVQSFDKDGHEVVLANGISSFVQQKETNRLRLDILKLLCQVTCKYHSVRKMVSIKPSNKSSSKAQDRQHNCPCHSCTQNDNGHNNDADFDDNDSQPSLITTSSESSYSDDSDSTFQIALDDDEIDDSDKMYSNLSPNDAHSVANKQLHSNNYSDGGDVTESDDESSIEEMHSDFRNDFYNNVTNPALSSDEFDSDNLICPGDVVEYRMVNDTDNVMRGSIETIVENEGITYAVVQNGQILQPKNHSVRKIKMYCSATQTLIPNPISEWFRLDKCVLQVGSVHNLDEDCISDGDEDSPDKKVLQLQTLLKMYNWQK